MNILKINLLATFLLFSINMSAQAEEEGFVLDKASYSLGSLGAFAEMVDVGVKELGLGTPMKPSDLDPLMDEALKIVNRHHVNLYRERDFLVTDLFPKSVAKGQDLLIVYKGNTLKKYQALKTEKKRLQSMGNYKGKARLEIAHKMGALLSYPISKITSLIQKNLDKES